MPSLQASAFNQYPFALHSRRSDRPLSPYTVHLLPPPSLSQETSRSVEHLLSDQTSRGCATSRCKAHSDPTDLSMNVGEHCTLASCGRLSFLPVACPLCSTTFCESHFLPEQHSCASSASKTKVLSDDELLRRLASSGASGRLPCQKQGCKKLSFEVQNAASSASSKEPLTAESSGRAFTHKAPRCERCKGFFCAIHRSAINHGCTAAAPMTEGQLKIKAMEDRKKKAAAIMAKNFPNRKA